MSNNDMKSWRNRLETTWGLLRKNETKVRFLLVGGLNTLFGLAIYPVLYYLMASLNLHYLSILIVSQIISITFAFFTTKHLVFRTTGRYLSEYGKFVTFHLSYLLVNLAALPALVELVGMHPVWAQTLFAFLVIITSYFWHSRITFYRAKESNNG
jgi:putative flippase GtrA